MFSKPQNHHKSNPRANFDINPLPYNIKNMPNLPPLSELPETPKITFKITKTVLLRKTAARKGEFDAGWYNGL